MDKRILVVEDEKNAARMLSTALRTLPHVESVSSVPSAEEAMLSVILDRPHLLLVDYILPGMSGLDLIPLVRRRNPHMAVILMSGINTAELAQAAEEAGVDAFFTKPLEIADVLAEVERLLKAQPQAVEVDAPLTMPEVEQESVEEVVPVMAAQPLTMKEWVQTLFELTHAATVAVLDDNGRVLLQSGVDIQFLLSAGWEVALMNALSAVQSAEKVLGARASRQYISYETDTFQLAVMPVGRHALLVLLPTDLAASVREQAWTEIFRAQSEMSAYVPPFVEEEEASNAFLLTEPQEELLVTEADVEIDLDALFLTKPFDGNADDFWDNSGMDTDPSPANTGYLNFDQAQQLGLVPDEGDAKER